MRSALPLTVPVGGSALRPQWPDLPEPVRRRMQDRLGSTVVAAVSQRSGFTPGFASRLRLADGRRVFVKAVSDEQDWLLTCYREEAAKLAVLPATVPAPRIQLVIDEPIDGRQWLLLVFDDIDGRPPERPWRLAEARAGMAAATRISHTLTPPPPGVAWGELADERLLEAHDWRLRSPIGWTGYIEELAALCDRRHELLVGDTLVHLDLRDDNLIIDRAGRVWICDWNFPARGTRWADALCLAISMFGDGLDADALLAETGLVGPEDREAVDCLLACLTIYFLVQAAAPPNPTSPYLRAHQSWYAEATGHWLRQRRGLG